MRRDELHILTGAPGSGKSAILGVLSATLPCVPEPAREILAEQRSAGVTGQLDPALFVDLLLQRSIAKYDGAVRSDGPVVFDRGIPDCIAYALYLDVDPRSSVRASAERRYCSEVLLLEPREDIYTVDDERTMSFADTVTFHEAIVDAYERSGYTIVVVPKATLGERAASVRQVIVRGNQEAPGPA